MSYSRWSTSVWYTFWTTYSGPNKDDQTFDVCDVAAFTYEQLRRDLDGCVARAVEIAQNGGSKIGEAETTELRGYMKTFMKEVDAEFLCSRSRYLMESGEHGY